jgi:hypothetical protein
MKSLPLPSGQRRERSTQSTSEGSTCPPPPLKNLADVMLFLNRVTVACDYEQSISVYYRDQQMYNIYILIIFYISQALLHSHDTHIQETPT